MGHTRRVVTPPADCDRRSLTGPPFADRDGKRSTAAFFQPIARVFSIGRALGMPLAPAEPSQGVTLSSCSARDAASE